jgi:hypothetical protein
MIALGCKYLRICHLNNCATGVATQNEKLRKDHYIGTVDMVVNFFTYVAEETREWLAKLGVRSLELIGRTDLLDVLPGDTERQRHLDLPRRWAAITSRPTSRSSAKSTEPAVRQGLLAEKMVDMAACDPRPGRWRVQPRHLQLRPFHRCAYLRRNRQAAQQPGHGRRRSPSASRAPRARASACGTPVA